MLPTTEHDVAIVLLKNAVLKFQNPDGKPQATRKNLPAIVVVSDQNMPVSYWFIT
jgi:hypothetical protein